MASITSPISRRNMVLTSGALAAASQISTINAEAATVDENLRGFVHGVGPTPRCDDDKVGVASPLWDAKSKEWLLWYYCRDRNFTKEAPPSLGTGRVALARSRDGIKWERVNGPLTLGSVLEPSTDRSDFDSLHVGVTDVFHAKDKYWMWYFGGDRSPLTFGGKEIYGYRMRVGLAQSLDGVQWTKMRGLGPGGSLFDYGENNWASWPNGFHDGDKFILFYTTVKGEMPVYFQTHVTYSKDGLTWDYQGKINWLDGEKSWDGLGVMTRHVLRNPFAGPKWLMVYTALDSSKEHNMRRSIGSAVSDDLINWRHLHDQPILEAGAADAWDGDGAAAPHLVMSGGEFRLYYLGLPLPAKAKEFPGGIGLATTTAPGLLGFERYRKPA